MTSAAHLRAVGYDEMGRDEQVRAEIVKLADQKQLNLLDSAVAVHYPDGSVTLDGVPFVVVRNLERQGRTIANFLAALALAPPPLTGAVVGSLQMGTRTATSAVGLSEDFVSDVELHTKPGTSVLFVLDQAGDMVAILEGIRGMGGIVLKSTVDLEQAKLIQSALANASAESRELRDT
jgi:uncharacterized membrane protein